MTSVLETNRASIARTVQHHEFMRRTSPELRRSRGHREWLHYFIAADGLEIFINLSVFDDLRPSALHFERGRVLVLVRHRGVWLGGVDEIPPSELTLLGGQLTARFGDVIITLDNGVTHLRGALRDHSATFDLSFEPLAFPSLASDVPVGDASRISWLVVPSLQARGVIAIATETYRIDALAYHDHNWGVFEHRDFRWQWGHTQDSGRSLVLARLLDGTASTAYLQSLFVWAGPRIARIFRGTEIAIEPHGYLRRRSITLPRIASLLAAGATEVPARLAIKVRSGNDRIDGELNFDDAACIVLAEGAGLETTLLYEVLGRARFEATIAGETWRMDAPVVFETMRKA